MGIGRFKKQLLGLVITEKDFVYLDIDERIRRQEPFVCQALPSHKFLYGREADPLLSTKIHFNDFERVQGFLKWFLSGYYLPKLTLKYIAPQEQVDFWKVIFLHTLKIKVADPISPLECLKYLHFTEPFGGLLYISDGTVDSCLMMDKTLYFSSHMGYGRYLTRLIERHLFRTERILVSSETARQIWLKLTYQSLDQITVKGLNLEQKWVHQLVLLEELKPLIQQAFVPLREEVRHLLEMCEQWGQGSPDFWGYGVEWLPDFIQTWFQAPFSFKIYMQDQVKMIEGLQKCLEDLSQ